MSLEAVNDNENGSLTHDVARAVTLLGAASFLASALLAGSYVPFPGSPFREYDLQTLGPILAGSGVVTIGGLLTAMFTQPANIEKC